MKRVIFSLSFSLFALLIMDRSPLKSVNGKPGENYPLVRQYGLIEKTKEYNLANASKGYLPQFTLSGKASWQSEVTELPVQVPGVDIKGLPKDQYQVMLELKQNIWDGGEIRSRKRAGQGIVGCGPGEIERRYVCTYRAGESSVFRNSVTGRTVKAKPTLSGRSGTYQ